MMGDMTDDSERAEELARGDEFYAEVDHQAAHEQGRIIGRRGMKPLIREMIEALEDDPNRTAATMHLIDRAKEALEND